MDTKKKGRLGLGLYCILEMKWIGEKMGQLNSGLYCILVYTLN